MTGTIQTQNMENIIQKGKAHFIINPELTEGKIVDIFATEPIVKNLSEKTIQQAINTALTEGVYKINLNADAHEGYGCPIGSVVATEKTIMPGPVGYDISCSVSYLQTDIEFEQLESKESRRALINKICEYIPYGTGTERVPKQLKVSRDDYMDILNYGAADGFLMKKLDIDLSWLKNLERKNLPADAKLLSEKTLKRGDGQIGSLGSGNHFLEAQKVKIMDKKIASKWGMSETVAFLTHCGSRGLGHQIALEYFQKLQNWFELKNVKLRDKELVYADIHSLLGHDYYFSMGCAANFAIVNHLVLNTAIKNALSELYPNNKADFVYLISHNLVQKEIINGKELYIHRKGGTRAFGAGHPDLIGTKYYTTGHPVIIPGSSISGSSVMAGDDSTGKNFYTVPHGAGRALGRREAKRTFTQQYVDEQMENADVLFNKRHYPIDEYSEAYKDYDEVIKSVELAGLAKEVARMKPIFVVKGE